MNDGIDLRRLHVLRTFAHYGTVTRAAESLHLTPSAVSTQLRQLANELGVPLTEAHGRGLRLTPAGRTLVDQADELLAHWERARAAVVAPHESASGTLRMDGFPTAVVGILAPAARRLATSHPDLDVDICEVESVEAYDRLLAGESDIAVVASTPGAPSKRDGRFHLLRLYREPLDLIVQESHPLASRDDVELTDLTEEVWVLPDAEGCDFGPTVRATCLAAGFTPRSRHHVHTLSGIAALVGAGLGVTLYPRLTQLPAHVGAVRIPVQGRHAPERSLWIATREGSQDAPSIHAGVGAIRDEVSVDQGSDDVESS